MPAASTPTAVLDANVLFSETTTTVFTCLAKSGLLSLLWSADIHREWMHGVSKAYPTLPADSIEARRRTLDLMFPHACVVLDDAIVASLQLPDANDRHVLAAAITARADLIVTANLGDFPAGHLARYGVRAQTADATLLALLRADPVRVAATLAQIAAPEQLEKLRRAGLRRFAKALVAHGGHVPPLLPSKPKHEPASQLLG